MTPPTTLPAFVKQAAALIKNDAQQITLVRRRVVVDGVVLIVTVQGTKTTSRAAAVER